MMEKLKDMSKDEKSLLLFLETRAVDYGGRVNLQHMNDEDMDITKGWNKRGFIGFGRIVIRCHNSDGTHWVRLSEEAWKLAHKERKARSKRMFENRTWISTEESREVNGCPYLSEMNNPNKEEISPWAERYN
ncbi:hypothetical protein LCGC14_0439420 [marine sediment metagenome]|uniref:Uncharacterized protein n=1 Tax=marine sediment metagenome TaxID=412755 RepID=A0A0F9SRV0_9ZZZZ